MPKSYSRPNYLSKIRIILADCISIASNWLSGKNLLASQGSKARNGGKINLLEKQFKKYLKYNF